MFLKLLLYIGATLQASCILRVIEIKKNHQPIHVHQHLHHLANEKETGQTAIPLGAID